MSDALPPNWACPTPVTTDVPGPPGATGAAGTNGVNAFSITQANFVVPAISSSVTVTVDNNSWMVVGQNVYVFDAGYFSVASLSGTTSVSLTYLDYVGNTAAGNTISAGAQVSPAGTQGNITDPLPVAKGGTGAATKALAQVGLGLGQTSTESNVSGLTQDLTNSLTIISGCTVTVPATGVYLINAKAEIQYQGATFAAAKNITLSVVDTTTSTTISTASMTTGIMTTATLPSQVIPCPLKSVTLTAGDVLQLQISVATAASAGHAYAVSAGLVIIPLALS